MFCGVHFMAETASVLCPEKHVLIPDLDAGCSLADSITAAQLREWKAQHPGAIVVMYVNTTAEVKAETDYCCTSANAVKVVAHIYREHGDDTEILFGPDMFLGAYVEKTLGRPMHVWDGECHVHAGIKPGDIAAVRAAHPGADFLIHPECGCSTSVMEYVAAGDVDAEGVHMLSTGGMLGYAARARRARRGTAIVATETGMLHPLRQAAPDVDFIAANEAAHCRYMKMITLPKLRDSLRDGVHEVKVPAGDRRAGAGADRADGGDLLATVAAFRRRGLGDQRRGPERPLRHARAAWCACARTRPACSSERRPGPPSRARPTASRPGRPAPATASPRRPRRRGHDVLGPALALGRRAALVVRRGRRRAARPRSASGRRPGPDTAAARRRFTASASSTTTIRASGRSRTVFAEF